MSFGGGFGGGMDAGGGDKSLKLSLAETFRLAWADPELRGRLQFVLLMFAVFTLGVHIPVPIPGVDPASVAKRLEGLAIFQLLDSFGGGALRRLSLFALSLNPYITASIIIQILTTSLPAWKKELEEGGEFARKNQNRKTRFLTLALCFVNGYGFLQILGSALTLTPLQSAIILVFWTAGTMFTLWIGEQISERGIGNGVSLIIFAGIIVGLPYQLGKLGAAIRVTPTLAVGAAIAAAIFLGATWVIVYFTTAQRRIPIQHMKRMQGTRAMGGGISYLPLSVNMAGVLPIIFAISLVGFPSQAGLIFGGDATPAGRFFTEFGEWLNPASEQTFQVGSIYLRKSILGLLFYTGLIFFFTYFWTAIQFNVEDIANNLKRHGSYIPGVRPGKQTKDFLDGVISRITVVGAAFISVIALMQYIVPGVTGLNYQQGIGLVGGTSLLIVVSVALETMRQIEAHLLTKQYGQ